MKKVYEKPMISVEELSFDMPVALNCVADFEDVKALQELGYFLPDGSCGADSIWWIPETGIIGPSTGDTVCYHSNVQTAFLS